MKLPRLSPLLNFAAAWPILCVVWSGTAASYGADRQLSFNRDIRPILSDNCFGCHGFDSKKRKAELRLDLPEGAYGKGESGELAIVPGKPEVSEFWKRILSSDKEEVMPPLKSHKTLSQKEKDTLRSWIEQGASYQKHWAFEVPVKAPIPVLPGGATVRGPIDAFLLEALQKEGLKASPEADKETLIRRVTLALTGLPPSVAEVDAFLADGSPEAYEKVVDRLLGSPQYGQQMARHWLDVARYGDTHGLHLDNERSMWPYRDWVVNAFNRNLSFKEFTIEQLAGDLLANPTQDQLTATGFNRCNVTTSEGGAIAAEFQFRYAVDRTATTAQTWMGLTAGCAVCHDHKFDPITQKEFYQLYAFFNSAADPAMDGNALLTAPVVKLATNEQASSLKELDKRVAESERAFKDEVKKLVYADPADANPPVAPRETELVLVEDEFPAGAQVVVQPNTEKLTWATQKDGPVSSGERSLRISGKAIAQNYYNKGAAPFEVPGEARLAFMVFLDPVEVPSAVMLQIHTSGGWLHRAIWGGPNAIGFGTLGTTTRYAAGELPPEGNWARLEVDAEKIGLKPGDQITGIAFTLFGGTAYFDQLSLAWRVDAANDPNHSFKAWLTPREGKDTQGLSVELNKILKKAAPKRTPAEQAELLDHYLSQVCALTRPTLQPMQSAWAKFRMERDTLDKAIPASLIMRDTPTPKDSFVMQRGEYTNPGEKVGPGVPAAFSPMDPVEKPTRLNLAQWLVSDTHPLTSRVTVNRFWQQFFGVGLVKSAGDFGSQGQPPSHPELLDWLAVTFRESGWDVKGLVRQLVMSAVYRQSSSAEALLWQRDPENRWLARGPRFRLDAEELRDSALAVSGLLDQTMGGKGVNTYQPPNIWEPVGFVGSNTRFYKQDSGAALYRRSLYTFLKRTAPPPFMANFDAPSREQSCTRRERSNTPMQALQLMNDVQNIEAARVFAQRLLREGGSTPEERITTAFRSVLGRRPSAEELQIVRKAFAQHLATYQQFPDASCRLVMHGASKPDSALPTPELAAWTLVCNLVLNLDEALTQH